MAEKNPFFIHLTTSVGACLETSVHTLNVISIDTGLHIPNRRVIFFFFFVVIENKEIGTALLWNSASALQFSHPKKCLTAPVTSL